MVRTVGPGADLLRLVFEFRHASWLVDEVYRLLSGHGAALCIADSPQYPRCELTTSNFMYFRFHGRIRLFASNYTKEDLAEEARKRRRFLHEGHDVYTYFNNDAEGFAALTATWPTQGLQLLLERLSVADCHRKNRLCLPENCSRPLTCQLCWHRAVDEWQELAFFSHEKDPD